MKLAILSRSLKAYSTRRLKEAAQERDIDAKVLDTLKFAIDLKPGAPDLYFRQKQLSDYDAVLPRIGASITYLWNRSRPAISGNGRLLREHRARHHQLSRQTS
jgi:hypothetical protein